MNAPQSKFFVDSHFHVFDAGVVMPGARYVPRYDAPLSRWQAAAQGAGVTRGVLVQTSFLGVDNSRMLEDLRQHLALLRCVAVVDPDCDRASLLRLHDDGVRGIRLNLAGVPHAIGGWARAGVIWDAIVELGWHVELHTDIGGLLETLAQLPATLPVVVDHIGKPDAVSAADPTVPGLVARES
ncbi:MAG: amidohydrolase family protein [Candidatus Protistobacter heckmanni]|nr:amidohydrolase family protein [Candidatus Protistobacter heckmanni]